MAKILVTGGSGFVGQALAIALSQAGHQVIALSRKPNPELQKLGIQIISCDLAKKDEIDSISLTGVETIFHTAAYVKMWGKYNNFYQTNFLGTKYLLEKAKAQHVKKFIYTSSPSVIADGKDLKGINEAYSYPKKYKAYYPQTKSLAEKFVLANNSKDFKTLALRPHLIWGPGDTNLIPTILAKAKSGKLKIIGDGQNKVDICYIEDCISAHLCAYSALDANPKAAGKAYFISQGEPVILWDWINQVLELNGLPKITRKIPFKFAYSLATVLELLARLIPSAPEPILTRFLVSEMATDHYFDLARAKEFLGFQPKYSVQAGMEKTFGKSNC